ncbi:MAG: glycosyltransferase family 2 protein [bacterium]|nr:glycosyltransferase family 2 protein [bacterium]
MLKNKLSVLIITKNNGDIIEDALESIKSLKAEIILVDSKSTDNTLTIAEKYTKKIFYFSDKNIGKKRIFALSKATGKWILILDADEQISSKLLSEIKQVLNFNSKFDCYLINFNNHLFGKELHYGGENYSMMRLIKRKYLYITPDLVHEKYLSKSTKVGSLNGKINHFSYKSLIQMYSKFTRYALNDAKQKSKLGEKTSLKKIFIYPLHMFWARFIEDKGYKDGLFRIPLDLGFAYMEFVTYLFIPFFNIFE